MSYSEFSELSILRYLAILENIINILAKRFSDSPYLRRDLKSFFVINKYDSSRIFSFKSN